jgi:aspartate/methionine/tyrosine aminotransferase
MTAEQLSDLLRREQEVSVVPGRFFEQPDYVRISLCAETATLEEGLRRIGRALDAN